MRLSYVVNQKPNKRNIVNVGLFLMFFLLMTGLRSGSAIKVIIVIPKKVGQTDKKEKKNIGKTPNTKTSGVCLHVWNAPLESRGQYRRVRPTVLAISYHVRERGLLSNLEQLRQDPTKKKTMTIFEADKRTKNIVKPTKDLIIKSLASLGVKLLAVIAGSF